MKTYHSCNCNPRWYHKIIRPLIRYEIHYNVAIYKPIYPEQRVHDYAYWAKRKWYACIWAFIDLVKSKFTQKQKGAY